MKSRRLTWMHYAIVGQSSNFYVQPVCSPTRSSLMTGRYPIRYGLQVGVIRPWADYGLSLEERTLPQVLKEVGYTTAICGKWHLGSMQKDYWPNARVQSLVRPFARRARLLHSRARKQSDWFRDGVTTTIKGTLPIWLALRLRTHSCSTELQTPFL